MATAAQFDEKEVFRRRVQQKLARRFTGDNDHDQGKGGSEYTSSVGTGGFVRKSPYSLQNFVWIFAAMSVFYFSDFVSVVMYDVRIKKFWFWIGTISFVCHVSIAAFLVVWLSFWKKIESDHWETMYPKAVPLATGSFIIGGISLAIALWPVWGIMTPVILGSLLMGVVVIIAMFG